MTIGEPLLIACMRAYSTSRTDTFTDLLPTTSIRMLAVIMPTERIPPVGRNERGRRSIEEGATLIKLSSNVHTSFLPFNCRRESCYLAELRYPEGCHLHTYGVRLGLGRWGGANSLAIRSPATNR